nr:uncharacterized protein LOC113813792 [Penaeus vannamei]
METKPHPRPLASASASSLSGGALSGKADGATAESSPALASATSQQWFVAWRWSWWWWSSSRPQRWLSLTPPNATWDTACTEDSQDTASQDSALEATEATAMDPIILIMDPTTDR